MHAKLDHQAHWTKAAQTDATGHRGTPRAHLLQRDCSSLARNSLRHSKALVVDGLDGHRRKRSISYAWAKHQRRLHRSQPHVAAHHTQARQNSKAGCVGSSKCFLICSAGQGCEARLAHNDSRVQQGSRTAEFTVIAREFTVTSR